MATVPGYALREPVYRTEYCTTYLGTDNRTLKPVLLKVPEGGVPPEEAAERLRREGALLRLVDPDGELKFEEIHTHKHPVVLVAEVLDLVPLRRHLLPGGVGMREFLPLALGLAEMVSRLHQEGIVHGDLNPDVLLLDSRRNVLHLFDFGRAVKAGAEARDHGLGLLCDLRPLAYLSPEQTERLNRPVDLRTDVYSLGVILYELATGRLPVTAEDPLEWFHTLVAGEIRPPREVRAEVPDPVSEIIMKCLARDAGDRYQSAAGVASDLRECLVRWQRDGRVESFAVGRRDLPPLLRVTAFVGRERELALLHAALERAAWGPGQTVLVTGDAGSGKTRLVRRFMEQLGSRDCHLASGKFETLRRAVPYQPITEALDQVLLRILSGNRQGTAYWKKLISDTLGSYASGISEVLPRVGELLGERPRVPARTALEAQERLLHALAQLVQVLAREGSPLVVFLDDLHWADPESLRILQFLLIERRVRHLLFIGAYREAEARENARFMEILRAMEGHEVGADVVRLGSATCDEVTAVVAGAMGCTRVQAIPLAEFVWRQTGGNFLFVKQLLESLHRGGLIAYGVDQEGGWRWDLRRLKDLPFAGDLIGFLLGRLQELPPEARRVIQLAACAGSTFGDELVAQVSGLPLAVVQQHLARCRHEGLIDEKAPQVHGFVHDRVHQAAYLSLPEGERREAHYRLGQLILSRCGEGPGQPDPAGLFAGVNQINLGRDVLVAEGQSVRGAELNLRAGQEAKRALAFSAALEYHRTGLSLLGEGSWESRYELVLRLSLERLECEYLCGNFPVAEALYRDLEKKVRAKLDRTRVRLIRITFLAARGSCQEAIDTALQGLQELGCPLPARPAAWQVLWALLRMRRLLHRTGLGRAAQPPRLVDPGGMAQPPRLRKPERTAEPPAVKDAEIEAAIDLLVAVGACAYQSSQNLLAMVSLKACELSLRHGRSSGAGCMALAMVYLHSLKDYRTSVALARAALEEAEGRGSLSERYTANFLYGAFILPWAEHTKEAEGFLRRALEDSQASCDLTYGGYAMTLHIVSLYTRGAPLWELVDRIGEYSRFEDRVKDAYFSYFLTTFRQFCLALLGFTQGPLSLSSPGFDEDVFYRGICSSPGREEELFDYCLCKGHLCYLMGDYRSALSLLERADRLQRFFYGELYLADHALYYCLTVLALFGQLSPAEKARYVPRLLGKMGRLKQWARHCPANFEHKHLLVSAELARVLRRSERAALLYDRAIRSARQYGYLHTASVACERAARHFIERGLEVPARGYLREARDGYQAWGARAKVEQLLCAHPWLAEEAEGRGHPSTGACPGVPEAGRNLPDAVDMSAIYRAVQILSGEIVLDELLKKMMIVAMLNAGADRGYFLMQKDGELYVEAAASTGPDGIGVQVLRSVPPERVDFLPRSLVDHVARTGDTVVLDDASRDGRFGLDPRLALRGPVSVLCLPVLRQGRAVGVLYLENSATAPCFHAGGVQTLNLLSAQIAISIENAVLYRRLQQMNITLEDKVRERTERLAQLQRETVDALLEKSRLEERNRIAREIHDTVGHTLTSVLMQIEAGKRLLQKNLVLATQKLAQAQQQVRNGLDEIRRSLHLLRETGTADRTADLEGLILDVVEKTGVKVDYRIDPVPRLDPARRYVLYRALQEGITNAIRHGRSKSFCFSLTEEEGFVRFVLQDFGTGADEIRPGFGLTSMQERVKEFQGTCQVQSRAGEGCTITIVLPLP